MKKTDYGVAKKVKQALLDGEKSKNIEKRFGISRSTVTRLKKEVDTSEMSTAEKTFIRSQSITLPPALQGKISEAEYYRKTLEDSEEGWLAHAKQGSVLYAGTSMCFVGIVYAETPEEIVELMKKAEARGLSFGYIIHDLDFWDHDSPEVREGDVVIYAEGERYKRLDPKKLHAHVMIQYESSRAWSTNQKLVSELFGLNTIAWQVVFDPAGMWEYFLHRTPSAKAKGKHQYDEAQRVAVNAFSVRPTKLQREQMAAEISHWILTGMYAEYGRYEYCDLMRKYDGMPMMLSVIRGNSANFGKAIDSLRATASDMSYAKLSDDALATVQEDLRQKLKLCDAEVEKRSKRSK